jgi:putative FmdB family regulatory protein
VPTYSYRCTECGTAFDVKQSFTDSALTECPTCGGVLRKVFSPVGVTFNGSGFYRTDSRGSSGSSAGTAKADAGAKTPAKSDSGSGSSSGSGSGSGSSSSSASSSSGSSGASAKPAAS